MIKAGEKIIMELRIGNWVTAEGRLCQVSAIMNYPKKILVGINGESISGEVAPAEIEPIPLTPEILEKCGFQKTPIDGLFIYKSYMYDTVEKCLSYDDDTSVGECDIKYLHQLQNLYYALTGNELTISEVEDERSVANPMPKDQNDG